MELSLEVAVNAELERWILGWGDQMEVLEPPTLRAKIAARLQRAAARHALPLPAPIGEPSVAPAPPAAAAGLPVVSPAPAEAATFALPPEAIPAEPLPDGSGEATSEGPPEESAHSSREPSEVLTSTFETPREDLHGGPHDHPPRCSRAPHETPRENLPWSSRPPSDLLTSTSEGPRENPPSPREHLPRSSRALPKSSRPPRKSS